MQVTPSVITPNPPNGPPEPEFQPLQADFPPVPPQEQESEFPDGPLPVQDLTEKPPEGPSGRWMHTMVRIQDRIYIYGGISSFTKKFYNDLWLFNTVEAEWEQLQTNNIPPLPETMARASAPPGGKPYEGGVPDGAPPLPGISSLPQAAPQPVPPPAPSGEGGDGSSLLQRYFRRYNRKRRAPRVVALDTLPPMLSSAFVEVKAQMEAQAEAGAGARARDDDPPEAADPDAGPPGPKSVQPDMGESIKGKPLAFEITDPFLMDDFYRYDLNMRSWKMMVADETPTPRYLHTAVVIGEKMVIFGGINRKKVILADVWIFDTETEKWKEAIPGELVLPRQAHTAVAIDDKMWVFGGVSYGYFPFNDVMTYDPYGNKWSQFVFSPGTGPCERFHHTAVAYKTDMYIFGGVDAKLIPLDDMWKYDTAGNAWEKLEAQEPRPWPRMMHTMTIVDSTIYVQFGISNNVPHEDMWTWDVKAEDPGWKEFNPTTAYPMARQGAKTITIYNDPKVEKDGGEVITAPPPFDKPTDEPVVPRHFHPGPLDADKSGGDWFNYPFKERPMRYRKDYHATAFLLSFGGAGPVPKSTVVAKLKPHLSTQGSEDSSVPPAEEAESFMEKMARRKGPIRNRLWPKYSSDARAMRAANLPY